MVVYFDELGFGQSDGLELSESLAKCAQKNLKILNKKCHIFHADATEYDGYSNYNYFYLYNPFGKETMRLVIEKIEESYMRKPRKITIIYYNPLCHEQIIESSNFHLCLTNENFYRRISGRITNIYINED